MTSTRNTILRAFKAVIVGMPDVDASRVRVGLVRPDQATTEWRAMVWLHRDKGSHIESNSEQEILVTTSVLLKTDDSKEETQLEQANDIYDQIHAAIETAFNDRSTQTTPFSNLGRLIIEQTEDGITAAGYDNKDNVVRIGEVWKVQYSRAEGTA